MARKRTAVATEPPPPERTEEPKQDATETSRTEPPPDANGVPAPQDGEKKPRPAFKVGPVATDKDHAVACAVWANEVTLPDGRTFTVHNVTIDARWYDPRAVNEDGSPGAWKSAKGFRGSQLGVLAWCLRRCEDFILSARDPAQCPF